MTSNGPRTNSRADDRMDEILADAARADLDAKAIELAKHDATSARTEASRAVDGGAKLLSAIGVLGAAALAYGGTVLSHGVSAGGVLLLVAGVLLVVAIDRCISVIQAQIDPPTPKSPGWHGTCAPEVEDYAKHYRGRAADVINAYAAEAVVVGRGAGRKHLKNKWTARLIRAALAIGTVGAVLAALHI